MITDQAARKKRVPLTARCRPRVRPGVIRREKPERPGGAAAHPSHHGGRPRRKPRAGARSGRTRRCSRQTTVGKQNAKTRPRRNVTLHLKPCTANSLARGRARSTTHRFDAPHAHSSPRSIRRSPRACSGQSYAWRLGVRLLFVWWSIFWWRSVRREQSNSDNPIISKIK